MVGIHGRRGEKVVEQGYAFMAFAKNVMSQINWYQLPTADLRYSGGQIIQFASNVYAQHLAEFRRVAGIIPSEEGRSQAWHRDGIPS
jgi:hypothetical protein